MTDGLTLGMSVKQDEPDLHNFEVCTKTWSVRTLARMKALIEKEILERIHAPSHR